MLNFNDEGHINPHDAAKWASSIAKEWGTINCQKKVKAQGLPGPAWLFDCSGHGGYIMVASAFNVPEPLHKFAADGIAVWDKKWVETYGKPYNGITVFVFEEDCDWAIFEVTYPDVARWRICHREKEWAKNPVIIDMFTGKESVLDEKRTLLAKERLKNTEEIKKLIQERLESARKSITKNAP
ncbi:MAG TPA: hypothetical protein DCX03_06490 [Bacteroidales bacterium]|nr:hypothetical protein [Bacteroidales bacterium]